MSQESNKFLQNIYTRNSIINYNCANLCDPGTDECNFPYSDQIKCKQIQYD